MMQARDALDEGQKQLTYFAPCKARKCHCSGFRPVVQHDDENTEGRSAMVERDNDHAPMTTDLEALANGDGTECRRCGHSITFHAEAIKSLSEADVLTYTNRITDLQSCCSEISEIEPQNESLQTLYIVMQVLMKSLRTLTPIEVPFIGKPNFETNSLSSYALVKKFIATRQVDNAEKQRFAEIGTLFLTEMNHWRLDRYEALRDSLDEPLGQGRYRMLYARMDYYVHMPTKYLSFEQYQTVDIFGKNFTELFCNFLINTISGNAYSPFELSESEFEENSGKLTIFAKELKSFLQEDDEKDEESSTGRRRESTEVSTDDVILKYVKRKKSSDGSESPFPRKASPSSIGSEVPKREKDSTQSSQPSTSNLVREQPETDESTAALRAMIRAMKFDGDMDAMDAMEPKTRIQFEALNTEVSRGMSAWQDEKEGLIEFRVIGNDLDPFQSHEQLAHLVELQILFGAQLPNMPKEYMTRLIFDSRHQSMVLLKKNVGVIGGICFRQFPSRGFVEIVFCAITSREQVKGYGSHLMNRCKDYMIMNEIYHMLTFADEYAIGYFTKQGFSDKLEISSQIYQGWIKEYEGATLMGCLLHPQISYTKLPDFSKEAQALLCGDRLANGQENRGRVYGGIEHVFREGSLPLIELCNIPGADSLKIEKSNIYQLSERDDELESKISSILKKLSADKNAWPFAKPVDAKEVPEYYEYTKHPIDLRTMKEKLKRKVYVHQHLFIADLGRMFTNCYVFNGPNTIYYEMAYKMNQLALKLLKTSFPDSSYYPELPSGPH